MTDPSVREDGEPEPALELEPERAPSSEASAEAAPAASEALPRGVRARERLLERAATLEEHAAADAAPFADLDQIGIPDGDGQSELELGPPEHRAPSAPLPIPARGRLSPNLTAVFGTLLGVATVAFLLALAMNLDVRLPARALAPSASVSPAAPPPATAAPERKKRERQKLPGPWRVADAKNDTRLRVVEGKVSGDAFLKALEKAGVGNREAYRVLAAMKGVRDFDRTKKSDRFVVLLDRASSRLKAFEYVVGPEEVYQAREGADGLLKGAKLDLQIAKNQISGALTYDGKSFDASAERAGFDPGLGRVVAKAIDGHLDMNELDAGDRVRVVAQEITVLGDFGRYAGVEAIEIRPADAARTPLRVYYFDAPGERGYYSADGRAPYEGGWRKPIPDAPVTSPFNLKRMHPVLKQVRPHLGIDFGAPTGTPIGAASFGTVKSIGYSGPAGNLVKVEHAGGVETGYAHLSRFAEGLKVGDKVRRLQLVGYVGSTGRSTGPHLHFSAQRNGEFFDPATLNLDGMRTLSKTSREAFGALKAKYDALLDAVPLPDPLPAPAPSAAPSGSASPAAPVPAGVDPGAEDEGEDAEPEPASAPAAPPAVAAPAARSGSGSAVHLTDKELLELQGASDDGEVAD